VKITPGLAVGGLRCLSKICVQREIYRGGRGGKNVFRGNRKMVRSEKDGVKVIFWKKWCLWGDLRIINSEKWNIERARKTFGEFGSDSAGRIRLLEGALGD